MTTASGPPPLPQPPSAAEPPPVRILRMDGPRLVDAAQRLVAHQVHAGDDGGRRVIDNATAAGINLSLFWGSIAPGSDCVREVCLAVAAAGRTASVFISAFPGE